MLERAVEKHFVDLCQRYRILQLKAEALGKNWPDRLLLVPGGKIAWVELKRPGQEQRPGQWFVCQMLRHLGFTFEKLDSIEAVDEFFTRWP